ncbi:hypothetical protein FOYG_15957 [Fusarium oxysporum NRRL 32931]|uniref:Uncharacterized protein n=1 Tax=Fusarium oxysporum NRRL 32931 TaxID=660029 RepID=W9HL71_FUSOX|nr:hypothetical protein FOYG_15957 [Fusarium oxysporum NRRL 32931]
MTKSEMKIEIVQDGVAHAKWCMTQEYKQVPTGLWAKCKSSEPPFNILAQGERVLKAKKPFPETESPEDDWNPGKPKDGAEQWNDVHNKWSSPEWNKGRGDVQQTFVDSWSENFGWGKALSEVAKLPKLLGERVKYAVYVRLGYDLVRMLKQEDEIRQTESKHSHYHINTTFASLGLTRWANEDFAEASALARMSQHGFYSMRS